MKIVVGLAAMIALAAPVVAQEHKHGMAGHDHAAMVAAAKAPKATDPRGSADAVVKVNGLVCDFCVQAVKKTFRRDAAVSEVAVDLDAKEIRLGFKPGRSMTDARIREAVTAAGYNVVGITRAKA